MNKQPERYEVEEFTVMTALQVQRVFMVAAAAVLLVARGAEAQDVDLGKPIYQFADEMAGTAVRIYQPRPGQIAWVASDALVTVRKIAARDRTVTTMETKADKAAVTIASTGVVVERGGRTVVAKPGDLKQAGDARKLVERSEALRHGIALLGRVSVGPRSPIEHQLRTTRAILLSLMGNQTGMVAIRAMTMPAGEPRVMAASVQSPTECWDSYAKEAIAAFKEYEDCLSGLSWYEIFDWMSCAVIYDLRAIGAMAWYLKCVGLGIRDANA
jgi:hypothetical protein